MTNPKLLQISEVQEITGFSRGKTYNMVASGELPSLRSGRSVRVPQEALMKWIERNTTGGEPAAGR